MGKAPTGYFTEPETVRQTEPTLVNKKDEHRYKEEWLCVCAESWVYITMRRLYSTYRGNKGLRTDCPEGEETGHQNGSKNEGKASE